MSIDHYENFPVGSILLPRRLRAPIAAIYRFARCADDFADEGNAGASERLAALAAYGEQLTAIENGEPVRLKQFQDLAKVICDYGLPVQLFHDLLSAFAQDVVKTRYSNFGEVLDYCRRSADPIGRLMLLLYGAATPGNIACSDTICSGLQIVNFLQDVAIDYGIGRIYLPQDEMARFGIDEHQIEAGRVSPAWRELMEFQVARARRMLRDGAKLGRALGGRIGLEMRLIIAGGERILTKILEVRCDVFNHRPVLRAHDWAMMSARAVFARAC